MRAIRGWFIFSSYLLLATLTWPPAARADGAPQSAKASGAESREYRRAVQAALAEFDAGNFPEARALFTRAHALYPNARTYRGLGFVAFELRNYAECVDYLQTALSSTEKPLSDSLRSSTEELLARAQGLIARIQVDVTPPSASVSVDGVPAELAPGRPLVLVVGDHLIELSASGYAPERRALKIAGGEELRLSLQLRALASEESAAGPLLGAPAAPAAPRHDTAPKKRLYKNPWLWTAMAVVVIGASVGTAVALSSGSKKHEEPADPVLGSNTPPGGVIEALVRR